ncbi:hypothetical protein [Burkholderia ubonensis]|uniref:hypothetical protein n=1 Tax=Burkholderia ubonensis TaxID=101571 RepID=UPI0012FAEC6F|nr:hypothetical protein [Burkholderia ubonensis]
MERSTRTQSGTVRRNTGWRTHGPETSGIPATRIVDGEFCRVVTVGAAAHVLVVPSAAESAFRIVESTSDSRVIAFSSIENMFCIAKIAAYLIEKQAKFISYVLYKTSPQCSEAALLFGHAVRFDRRSGHAEPFTQMRFVSRR